MIKDSCTKSFTATILGKCELSRSFSPEFDLHHENRVKALGYPDRPFDSQVSVCVRVCEKENFERIKQMKND